MADSTVIHIFDTTLRDSKQSLGASMTLDEKLQVADQLVRLRVDVIEAGFPARSPGDLIVTREIAQQVSGPAVAALARANINDIEVAWEAIREAEHPIIHVFLAVSEIQLKNKLHIGAEDALQCIQETIAYARNLCPTVQFSAEDATRSDRDYLCRVCEIALQAGATTISLPDTIGYVTPNEYGEMFRFIRERVSDKTQIILSTHCQNNLGMATANTLAAIAAGACQVEVTIGSRGERAGSTSAEDVVMSLRTRPEQFRYAVSRIKAEEFGRSSQLMSHLADGLRQPRNASAGTPLFSHEVGRLQYNIRENNVNDGFITPQSAIWSGAEPGLSKYTSHHGLEVRLRQLGYRLNANELRVAYNRFLAVAEKKTDTDDADLIYIAEISQETPVAI